MTQPHDGIYTTTSRDETLYGSELLDLELCVASCRACRAGNGNLLSDVHRDRTAVKVPCVNELESLAAVILKPDRLL